MYNKSQKEEFIRISKSKDNVSYLFNKTNPYEQQLDKDISLFKKEEILNMFINMKITSNAILNNYISILSAYVNYINATNKTDNINVFNDLSSQERKELINNEALRSKFLTKEELIAMCSLNQKDTINSEDVVIDDQKIGNPQVAAIVGLIWSGVSYKNKCEQVLNASAGQFRPSEDLFVLHRGKEKVELHLERWVSNLLINIILKENYYIVRSKKDGTLSKREVPLSGGYKYLFRQIRTKDVYSSDVPISYVALHYRFKTAMKHLGRTSITFKSIADSRVLHEYHQLENKNTENLKELIKLYGHTEPTGLAIQYYKQGYRCVYEEH